MKVRKTFPSPAASSAGAARPAHTAAALSYQGLAAGLWAVFALAGYLAIRPPRLDDQALLAVTLAPLLSLRWPGPFAHAGELATAALLVLLELATAFGLGGPAVRWLGASPRRAGERLVYALLAGLGAYAFVAWGLGALGFYTRGMYVVLLAGGVAAAARELRNRPLPRPVLPAGRPPAWILAGLVAVALTQVGVMCSAASPLHVSDESIYHLGYARWYLWAGKAVYWPSNLLEFNPQLATMVYGTPLAFGLTFGVKWMHWVTGLLATAGLWLLLDRRPAWVRRGALLGFLTLPAVWGLAGRGFNDLFVIAYAVGAVLAAERAARDPGRGGAALAALAGVFTGLSGGCKYTGLLTGLTLLPFLGGRRLVLAAGAAAATVAPWLARNWIQIGNPVFPYAWKLLGGLHYDAHQDWRLRKEQMQGEPTLWERLRQLPLDLWNIPVGGAGSGPDGAAGPLLGMTLMLVLSGVTPPEGAALALYFLPVAFSASSLRFLFPMLPLMMLVLTRRLAALRAGRVLAAAGAAGFCAVLLFQGTEYYAAFWKEYDDPLPVLLGAETVPRYLDRRLYPPIYYPANYPGFMDGIGATAPRGSRVMVLGGYGGALWVPRPALFNPLPARPPAIALAREARDPAGIAKKFRQLGITHVAVNREYNDIFFDFWKMWDWNAGFEAIRWVDYWRRYPVRAWHWGNAYEVYALSRTPHTPSKELVPGLQEEGYKLLSYMIRKQDFQQSDTFLRSMLAIFPDDPAYWLRAAEVAVRKGQVPLARTYAAQVERLAPGSAFALRARSTLAMAQGRDAEAAALLERVLAREAWDAQGWLDLSMLDLRLGRTDRAWWAAHESADAKEFRPLHW